ncbi:RNA polymerase sigma-70 factor (ECF subfamily) [Hymenobacter luteus]|uniref:RNA polymerase sigma-70 factor (ECF subfamily) n=2 Tax=Hymenobacter TaxID=89966 RepID=A0A7W9T1X8_9BACT|nr:MULTISPECIES: sigma-70 family RNA polymerase sigma factor [Hymenobacter]MBB4601621.1 RNA polymerase sigma-70 factor (ECF subfamily) [Hymenobacter latericoloratus]MBB6059951.1 RNA polymerase sigma-70 factor (ECF subfamily) [Hymenobacter luteus]
MASSSTSSPKHHQLYAARPDEALLRALREDDKLAFAEIYERYWELLLGVAYRKLHSREAAEEVVQDLFAALWLKRRTQAIQHLKSYLLKAAKYRVIDVLKARLTQTAYLERTRPHVMPQDHSTEETVAADDLSLALLASLMRLPEHTREVFRLSRLEHQSVPEIAVRLNLSRKTVEYHLTRALKALRVSLRDFLTLALVWWW